MFICNGEKEIRNKIDTLRIDSIFIHDGSSATNWIVWIYFVKGNFLHVSDNVKYA